VSGSNAEVSEYIFIPDQWNLQGNTCPNITIVLCENAVHLRICNLPFTTENLKNKVNCTFACLFICLYEIWVVSRVKYSEIHYTISICQKLRIVEIKTFGPHVSSTYICDIQLCFIYLLQYMVKSKQLCDACNCCVVLLL